MTITRCDEGAEGEVVIPDEIEGLPVTSIGTYAIGDCSNLTSITSRKHFTVKTKQAA